MNSNHDLRGVQFSLEVTDTQVLSPVTIISPILGDLFPGSSITSTTPTSEGWSFLLTDLVSTPAVSGTGVVISLPFVAQNEGCTTLFFADHQLSNGSAQLVPHSTNDAYLCVIGRGNMQGNVYLDWRSRGHFTDTQVVLMGRYETYTTTTDSAGYFALDSIYADTYSLQASHSLFVQANRTVTVVASLTTTVPQIGLWAGDIDQDQDVDLYDWYLLAAAIYPVDDPDFDLNDDGSTNIQDLVILAGNQGQPNMTTTNPPIPRPGLTSQGTDSLTAAHSTERLKLVSLSDDKIILRIEEADEPVYAIGVRLALPVGAAVTEVEPGTALSGGFLRWHQEGQKLYIVVASTEGQAITPDTDVVIIHGTTLAGILIEAENSVTGLR